MVRSLSIGVSSVRLLRFCQLVKVHTTYPKPLAKVQWASVSNWQRAETRDGIGSGRQKSRPVPSMAETPMRSNLVLIGNYSLH